MENDFWSNEANKLIENAIREIGDIDRTPKPLEVEKLLRNSDIESLIPEQPDNVKKGIMAVALKKLRN